MRSAFLLKLTAATVLPALALTLLSGAGGWGGGDSDWLKHDALLRDLVTRRWPVTYETTHGPVWLVYYLAFYLPAAFAGKLAGSAGYQVASQGIALTTFVGVVLSAWWLVVLGDPGFRASGSGKAQRHFIPAGAPLWIGAMTFFGFSGLDPLGKMLVNIRLHLPVFYGDWSDVEWWAQFAQYSSNAATLFWAPQHAFGGWLPAALVLDDWFSGGSELQSSWVLYLCLALAWSPFAALGLAMLIVGLLLWRWTQEWRRSKTRAGASRGIGWWRTSLTFVNGAGALSGAFFALYLLAHFQTFYLPAAYQVTPGHQPMPLLEQFHTSWLALYLGFIAIEFGGFSLTLTMHLRRGADRSKPGASCGAEVPLLIVATLILLVLPWFHYGFANDLVMRGAIPALFVLQVLLVRMLTQSVRGHGPRPVPAAKLAGGRQWPALIAGLLLFGGLVNTGLEYRRHILRIVSQGSLHDARTREPVRTLAELQRTIYSRPGFDFSRQYLGSADSVFARYLARRNVVATVTQQSEEVDF